MQNQGWRERERIVRTTAHRQVKPMAMTFAEALVRAEELMLEKARQLGYFDISPYTIGVTYRTSKLPPEATREERSGDSVGSPCGDGSTQIGNPKENQPSR